MRRTCFAWAMDRLTWGQLNESDPSSHDDFPLDCPTNAVPTRLCLDRGDCAVGIPCRLHAQTAKDVLWLCRRTRGSRKPETETGSFEKEEIKKEEIKKEKKETQIAFQESAASAALLEVSVRIAWLRLCGFPRIGSHAKAPKVQRGSVESGCRD